MKNIRFCKTWIAFIAAGLLAVSCSSAGTVVKSGASLNIDAQKASQIIEDHSAGNDLAVIDVRTPEEFASGHIGGAVNIDVMSSSFREVIGALEREKIFVIYCLAGSRSSKALAIMQEMGFKSVYNLFGGIKEWKSAGYPVVQ